MQLNKKKRKGLPVYAITITIFWALMLTWACLYALTCQETGDYVYNCVIHRLEVKTLTNSNFVSFSCPAMAPKGMFMEYLHFQQNAYYIHLALFVSCSPL